MEMMTDLINEVLAANSGAMVVVICAHQPETPEEEASEQEDAMPTDNWYAEEFWDVFFNGQLQDVAGAGGGGGSSQDAILMDNPSQS